MKTWQIGDIAKKSGIPASTIRYYEEIQLLPPAERVNGRRRYNDTILQKLNLIRLAQQAGFTIAEIQTLLYDFPENEPPSTRWQLLARQKLNELDRRLQTIQTMQSILEQTLNCQCPTLDDCATGISSAKSPA